MALLPRAPGVYVLDGADGRVPLYIGNSVDIRQRLTDHLRTPEEARLLRQTQRIDFTRTAGDLGAQLLEAQQVKLHQPVHNRLLRRRRELYSIRLLCGQAVVVHSREVPFVSTAGLHGLFASRVAALQALRTLADDNRLCYALMGIEPLPRGRACFRATIDRCAGACCGREPLAGHEARLEAALQPLRVVAWPCAGAVGIVEAGHGMAHVHVVRDWHDLGSAPTKARARRLDGPVGGFERRIPDPGRIPAGRRPLRGVALTARRAPPAAPAASQTERSC